jgi:ribose transport system permease protein
MNLTRIDSYVQMIVLGAIVTIGVLLDRLRLERR